MLSTFKRGIYPRHSKQLTQDKQITPLAEPKELFVPLFSYNRSYSKPVVDTGDFVKRGQLIAAPQDKFSVNIFSPVSGKAAGVVKLISADGTKGDFLKIENDFTGAQITMPPLEGDAQPQDIIKRIEDAGIIGMGGAAFPTHIKLSPKTSCYHCEVLIINAAECEPYLTCDYRIIMDYTEEFLKGIELLKRAAGAKFAVIGIEDNKPLAVQKLLDFGCFLTKSPKHFDQNKINISVLKSKYPQGGEKQLIYAVTGRVQREGQLPLSCSAYVQNVHTVYAVYNACILGVPLYERVVTVTGGAVQKPGNYMIKAGTSYGFIAKECGADMPELVVSGGPMMGSTAFSDEVVSTVTNGGILFLSKKEYKYNAPSPCIACSKCVQACPMRLMPVFIDSCVLTGNYAESKKYGAMQCIECGCCSFVCPAKKPLVQSIKLAKKVIRERGL